MASRLVPARVAGVVRRSLYTSCTRSLLQNRPQRAQVQGTIRTAQQIPKFASVRWHSSSGSNSKVYAFQDVQSISSSPSEERILIDVREPHEYEAGYIPSAINMPISSQPDAIFLPEEEFEDRFGFSKPAVDKEVIFYCKSGVRSSAAAQLAQQHGYKNVAEYRGSWLDWTKQGGETAK